MELHTVRRLKGNKLSAKRVGRGIGSGKGGHYSGRGGKGQTQRSSTNRPVGFEGGQVPLFKRLPMLRGNKNPPMSQLTAVDITKLSIFKSGEVVTPIVLLQKKVLKNFARKGIKIIGNSKFDKKLTLKDFSYSKAARESLEKAGSVLE